MELIEKKIKDLEAVGVTLDYQRDLLQLINKDKAEALENFKKDLLNKIHAALNGE